MSATSYDLPVTEIIYLEIDPVKNLKDENSEAGTHWVKVLSLSAESAHGFQHQYWGRGISSSPAIATKEEPSKVRLHIVRSTLEQHSLFRSSSAGQVFQSYLEGMIIPGTKITVRHALLEDFMVTDGCRAVEAPLTGSALYRNSTDVFANYAWPLWTHIVGRTSGVKGVAGGKVLASEQEKEGYLVYVGWENYEAHQRFRASPLCADRRIILTEGNEGMVEYYHVAFEKTRAANSSKVEKGVYNMPMA